MALSIRDTRTHELARELALATGESIGVATRTAIEERLTRVRGRAVQEAPVRSLRAIVERGRARADLSGQSAEEIIGYNAGPAQIGTPPG